MSNAADLHPDQIAGYHDGPFARRPELPDHRLFWHGHLYSCAQGNAGTLLWGDDCAWADHRNFQRRLWERGDWPVFTIPLAAGPHGQQHPPRPVLPGLFAVHRASARW
ncbi:hypothetical protein ACWEO4_47700 [Streptomyces sp. NPDC004393]